MGKIDKFLRGLVGSVVFYERDGKQFARKRPKKRKLAAASKARAVSFGHASTLSAWLVDEFTGLLKLPKFPKLQQRLAGTISRWLGGRKLPEIIARQHVSWVEDFNFNLETKLNAQFKKQLNVITNPGEEIRLSINSFSPVNTILAPDGTSSVACSIAVVSCLLKKPDIKQSYATTLEIPYTTNVTIQQQINTGVQVRPGELTLVVISLLFKGKDFDELDGVQHFKWRPVEVVGAAYG